MIHTLIFGATLGTLAGLLWWADTRQGGLSPQDALAAPARALRWWAAGARARAAARRDWVAGADLQPGWVATAPAPADELPEWHDVPPRDSSPACKADRPRCRECRLGGDCRELDATERAAYWQPATTPLHLQVVSSRLAQLRDLREAVRLAPETWRDRLGRHVQLTPRREVALP